MLRLRYNGRARDVEPHDYGRQGTAERLLVYQRRGPRPAPRRSAVGWRLLDVSKIEACAILDEPFAGSRGHLHSQRLAWDALHARVR